MREKGVRIPDGAWCKSSYSGANTTECVETALLPRTVAVRDSTDQDGPVLTFRPEEWRLFVAGIREGSLGEAP